MTKYLIAAAALVVAGIPAAFGLAGNASFTHDIPVRVPDQVQLTPVAAGDDDGTADQGHGDAPGTAGAGDDRNDDHGVDNPTPGSDDGTADQGHGDAPGTEPGDDHGGSSSSGSSSGRGGSDDLSTDDSGHRGGGSDDGSGHD